MAFSTLFCFLSTWGAIFYFLFFEHNHTPSGKKNKQKKNGDWNAVGNYIQVHIIGWRPFCIVSIVYITTTHEALAALLTTVTYHQLASPQTHSILAFWQRAGLCKCSYSHTHTHTHHLLCAGHASLWQTYKALYLSCWGAKDTTKSLWETVVF